MKALQILLSDASLWDRKCQRTDFETLSREASVELLDEIPASGTALEARVRATGIDVLHVYGNAAPHARLIEGAGAPWIVSAPLPPRRFSFGRRRPSPVVASPLAESSLPEAVEALWRTERSQPAAMESKPRYRIGSFGSRRKGVRTLVAETIARLARFRDDLDWTFTDTTPSLSSMRDLDLWVDPANDPDDFDGLTAEALVAGKRVVACRTPINRLRLEGGIGFTVPTNDPNELAHAVVTALFKDELVLPKL